MKNLLIIKAKAMIGKYDIQSEEGWFANEVIKYLSDNKLYKLIKTSDNVNVVNQTFEGYFTKHPEKEEQLRFFTSNNRVITTSTIENVSINKSDVITITTRNSTYELHPLV